MIHRLSSHRGDAMPVKVRDCCFEDLESYLDLGPTYCQLEPTLSVGIAADFYTSTIVPSEDIWKKFDLPDLPSMAEVGTWSGVTEDDCELNAVVDQCASASVMSPMAWATLDASGVFGTGKDIQEIRQHDCMWAGHCINKEHKRTLKQLQQQTNHGSVKSNSVQKDDNVVVASAATPRATVCRTVRTGGGGKPTPCTLSVLNSPKTDVCVVKTSGRSLLLTSRTTNIAKVVVCPSRAAASFHRPSLESDGNSPRPETPQSLSESEEELDDHPRFRHSLDMVVSSSVAGAGDLFDKARDVLGLCKDYDDLDADCSMPVSVSEVTGQIFRPVSSTVSTSKKEESDKTSKPSDAYYSDHSYHLSKGNVRMDNLGVQTPSDSEEEIDVVSVGDKVPANRGSVTLPTNPSPRDRQQLQLTVASAIKVKQQYEGVGVGGKKRSAGAGLPRGTKRAKHQYHHRLAHHKPGRRPAAAASSDSEPDSCEKRSLHNNMERQRRIDLRNLVEGLRVLVPEVACKKRAAKVVILREAAGHCHRLREQGKGLVGSVAALRREQEQLRARVSQLRRDLAASR